MTYPFKNLVFEGGGVKGIAYVGALRELEQKVELEKIQRVGGTSAGAINAVLLSLDFSLRETTDILSSLNFKEFMDDSWGVVRDTKRLVEQFGWYKGDFFRGWIGNLIREKTGSEHSTFNDLKVLGFRDLYVVATNLSTGFSEAFSFEHTPRMRVADAVRRSMSIPLFFAAVRDDRNDVYVDGGIFDNYPIKLFDREKYVDDPNDLSRTRRPGYYDDANKSKPKNSSPYLYNKETLGFRLDTGKELAVFRDGAQPPSQEINDFFDYAWALVNAIMGAQDNQHLHSDDWHRTIYIDTLGVGTTDFDLNAEKKELLVKSGAKGTKDYFTWYKKNDPKNQPMNHPDYVD